MNKLLCGLLLTVGGGYRLCTAVLLNAPDPMTKAQPLVMPGRSGGWLAGLNERGDLVGSMAGEAAGVVWAERHRWADGTRALVTLPQLASLSDVNNHGVAAGSVERPEGTRACRVTRAGQVEELGISVHSLARGINDREQIVGQMMGACGRFRAFLWSRQEGLQDLSILAGAELRAAYDINNAGQIVGERASVDGPRAFLWDRQHGLRDLGRTAESSSAALGINDRGQIVGNYLRYGQSTPFLWDAGRISDLHSTRCANTIVVVHRALRINNAGEILAIGDLEHQLTSLLLQLAR